MNTYADQRARDVMWMTADERNALDDRHELDAGIRITVTSTSGYTSYTLPRGQWRSEVERLEADPSVTHVTARQVAEFVQYAYNKARV